MAVPRALTANAYWLALPAFINCYFVRLRDGWMLVDTGLPFHAGALLRHARALMGPGELLRFIVITHTHPDHVGALDALALATGAAVWVHTAGERTLREGLSPDAFPGALGARIAAFYRRVLPYRPVEPSGTFEDGDELPFAPGWRVIHTPGHTPDQCAFLDGTAGVVLTGDTVLHLAGRLVPPLALFTPDRAAARASIARLAAHDFEIAAFGHGPPITHAAARSVRHLAASLL
ncbi:MAG TPA: hypothetical protein DEP84_30240 [Chloroflexi bacterium]|nr:hypothetical protein [Chloroflexota bacterium]